MHFLDWYHRLSVLAMIQLISREEAFAGNRAFESFIFDWQEKLNNPIHPNNSSVIGNDLWDNIELRYRDFLTQEDCDAYDQQLYKRYLTEKDLIEDHGIEFGTPDRFIGNSTTAKSYFSQISKAIQAILTIHKVNTITLLCHWPLSTWLARENEFERSDIVAGFRYLRALGVTETFNGGIRASGNDIEELIYYYSLGGSSVFDYCFFRLGSLPVVVDICNYGALHLNCTTESDEKELSLIVQSCGLVQIQECDRYFYKFPTDQ